MKVCSAPGCPTLHANTGGRCTVHTRQADKQRGTRQARGYGVAHVKLRAEWAPRVATGTVKCWRCGEPIAPGATWHLGHDDHDRTIHRGPEHWRCNLSAAGKASHRRGG